MPTQATFYFSFRSPYSWLAYHDLSTKHPEYLDVLRWQPFWEPNESYSSVLEAENQAFPYVAMSKAKHLYMLQDVRRQARSRGLRNAWPIDERPSWEISHLPWYVAAHHGYTHQYMAAVYRARWVEGADIHDPAVIDAITQQIAPQAFPPVAEIMGDPQIERLATATLQEIWQNDVFGVPYFLKGAHRFWGLDRLQTFLAASPNLTRSDDKPEVPALIAAATLSRAADSGHEGGCG